MQSGTLVSIVITCYNYGEYLAEAVESALAQTHKPIEILVVDDGSTDDTRIVAGRFGHSIRYHFQTNGGLPNARNTGLRLARGDYIVYLDADDILVPDYVAKLLAVHQKTADLMLGFVYTQAELFGTRKLITTYPEFSVKELKRGNFIHAAAMLRADALRRTGYDESLRTGWEDWDLYLRLVELGYYGRLVNEPLLRYRQHQSPSHSYPNLRHPGNQRQLRLAVMSRHPGLFSRLEYLRVLARPFTRFASWPLHALRRAIQSS